MCDRCQPWPHEDPATFEGSPRTLRARGRSCPRARPESAGQALTDLRDLVRGIHPPVLADRGLSRAIQAATLLCPVPVETDLDLPGRPEAPVESALYFATVEALSNIAKHSHARHAWVRLRHARGTMRLTVGDVGHGGANPSAGSRLHGIGRRLSAFDGTLTVHSPPGGPSVLTMELPCALSSPKTSPSCGTGWSACSPPTASRWSRQWTTAPCCCPTGRAGSATC